MADEKDPIAATNNAAAKEEAESEGRGRNFTDAFDASDRQGVVGPGKNPQHRAGPGEGVRADFAKDGEAPQISVFDGKGNESVVVASQSGDGRPAQGSGSDPTAAEAEAREGEAHPGSAFDPSVG